MSWSKLTLVLCGSLLLTGCFYPNHAPSQEEEYETIHLLGTVGVHEIIVDIIETELANNGIKLEKNFFYWDTYLAKARQAILNETGEYDVILGPTSELYRFIQSGKLIPLNDPAEEAGLHPDALYPQILNRIRYNDRLYVLPYLTDVLTYIYQRDLFTQTNTPPPTSIRQMYETARQMTTDSLYGLAFPANPYDTVTSVWTYFLWSFGGDYFNAALYPIINSPQSVAATHIYSSILQNCAPSAVATWKTEEAVDFFTGGKLAAMIVWSSAIAVLNNSEKNVIPGEIGCTSLPLGPANKAVSPFASWGMAIPRSSKHIIAAKKFAVALVSMETFRTIAELGIAPTPLPKINQEYARQNPETPLAIATKALEQAAERPYFAEANQYIPIINLVLNDILMGADVQTTLNEANNQISLLMKAGGYYGSQ